jgi:beta-glucanase (GH16 family)
LFEDDFNGSSLNLKKWTPSCFGWTDTAVTVSPNSPTAYDPKQVSVKGGNLRLQAVKKTEHGEKYTSGCVWTGPHKFAIAPTTASPVAMEARIYLPAASPGVIANWPAFWASGTNWPTNGEIDVMEGLGGKAAWHFHYGTQSNPLQSGATVRGNYTGWHTYGALWTPTTVTFYYDGKKVGTVNQHITHQVRPPPTAGAAWP